MPATPKSNDSIQIAAAYIRVSTDDQIEYSPDSQLAEIRKYAKAHNMVVPDELVFADEGISGKTTEKRPAFNRMIGMAKHKPKPFDVLLLWKFSRFARNREDSIVYKSMLRRELGIDVISISEPVGDDKISMLIEAMIEAMDEYYSINLAEEVRRGMTQRIKTGKPNTHAPFGYRIENGEYLPDADTVPIVQKIYADFIDGKGARSIAVELSDMGIRTIHGNRFENRTVEYILRNPVYIGKVRWTPTGRTRRAWDNPDTMVLDGIHEPIISQEVFDAAQNRLAELKHKYPRYARTDGEAFTLKGIVKCSNCGATLTRVSTKEPGLQCHQYAKGKCTESHFISIKILTHEVLTQIYDDFATLNFGILFADGQPTRNDAEDGIIARQIAKEQQKLQRVREAYEAGVDTLAEYKQNKQTIAARIQALEQSRPAPTAQITPAEFAAKHQKNLAILFSDTASEAEKNEAIRGFVQKILFNRKDTAFKIYYSI